MFRSTAPAPPRSSGVVVAAPPALTLEQLIRSRPQQQSHHAAPHAPPPAATLYPALLASEITERCVEPSPNPAAEAWTGAHTLIAAPAAAITQDQSSLVAMHAHPAADIWRAKWTEMATTHIPKSQHTSGHTHSRARLAHTSYSDLNPHPRLLWLFSVCSRRCFPDIINT